MKKDEFITILAKELGTTKVETEEFLKGFDRAVIRAFNQIEVKEKFPVSGLFDIQKNIRKGQKGECKIPGREGSWETKDKIIAKVKTKKAFNDAIINDL